MPKPVIDPETGRPYDVDDVFRTPEQRAAHRAELAARETHRESVARSVAQVEAVLSASEATLREQRDHARRAVLSAGEALRTCHPQAIKEHHHEWNPRLVAMIAEERAQALAACAAGAPVLRYGCCTACGAGASRHAASEGARA